MKIRLLVVMFVLFLILTGCGDYKDIKVYEEMIVNKYEEIDEGGLKEDKEKIHSLGMEEEVKEFINVNELVMGEYLNISRSASKDFYEKFQNKLSTIEEIDEEEDDVIVAIYKGLSESKKEILIDLVKGMFDEYNTYKMKTYDYIKNMTRKEKKEMKKYIESSLEEGSNLIAASNDYMNGKIE